MVVELEYKPKRTSARMLPSAMSRFLVRFASGSGRSLAGCRELEDSDCISVPLRGVSAITEISGEGKMRQRGLGIKAVSREDADFPHRIPQPRMTSS